MKLSICIPTYNRCYYLINALEETISQAEGDGILNLIEFCISDNCSTDNTKEELLKLKIRCNNATIKLNFNSENVGPDRNFIIAMNMASGEYSILKGDDDYFKRGSLKYLLSLFEKYPDIGIFLSDVDMIDTNRNYIGTVQYLREKYDSLIVDFSSETEVRSYFSLCNSIHALCSFISGVVYKSEIIAVEFDECFIGTSYAFEFYFWKYLSSGNKLMYFNHKFMDATVGTVNVWSSGIARNALDIHAFAFIADYFYNKSTLNQDMKNVVNRMYSDYCYIPFNERCAFKNKLLPALEESNHPLKLSIRRRVSICYQLLFLLLTLLPKNTKQYLQRFSYVFKRFFK